MKRNKSSVKVYDYSKVWHYVSQKHDNTTDQGKKKSDWHESSCGVYFSLKKRESMWETCKKCLADIREGWNTDSYSFYTTKAKPKPKRIVEKSYKPPMGLLE